MRDNNRTPNARRCINCARPMQLLRKTSRFGGLADLLSFYCVTCDEWHVEEGANESSWRELRRAILRPPPWKIEIERGTKNLSRLGTGSG